MTIQEIKKQFFALRNGMLADTLRKAGMPYGIIFGMNVPQLGQLARDITADPDSDLGQLAGQLWADRNVRESRLLACWLFPVEAVTPEAALAMMADVQTREEADILAFRLLRRLPFAERLATEAPADYAREALVRNLDALRS